jgi:hypothetical protein
MPSAKMKRLSATVLRAAMAANSLAADCCPQPSRSAIALAPDPKRRSSV